MIKSLTNFETYRGLNKELKAISKAGYNISATDDGRNLFIKVGGVDMSIHSYHDGTSVVIKDVYYQQHRIECAHKVAK